MTSPITRIIFPKTPGNSLSSQSLTLLINQVNTAHQGVIVIESEGNTFCAGASYDEIKEAFSVEALVPLFMNFHLFFKFHKKIKLIKNNPFKNMLKNLIFTILTIFAVSAHAEDLKIKVGGVLALSGLASPHGKSIQEGMLLAQEDLKKENIDIQFTFEDDNTQTTKTIAAIQSLSARGIKFVVGPTWSYQVASALKILEKSKILAFAPACSSEFSGGAHPNVIYGTLKTSEKMKPTSEWIKSNNIKKVMILRDNAEWGTIHEAMFKEAAENQKASILSTDTFNYGDEASAMQAFATKVRNTKPDAILMTSTKDAFSLLMKKLIEYKVKIKILSTQDAYDAKSSKLLPANFENVSVSYLSYPSSEKYTERFFTKYSKNPYIFSDAAYDAVMMIGRAVKVKGENIQDLRNYILNDMRYDGLSGPVLFDSNGDVKKGTYQIVELTP